MITETQFRHAADLIGCKVACIKAVYDVEAASRGFLPDGRVKILFEGHRFWRQLVKFAKVDPHSALNASDAQLKPFGITPGNVRSVLYETWTRKFYRKDSAQEWDRMSWAIAVCKYMGVHGEYALKSASYGSFQIMGENCELCGYATAHEMGFAFSQGEHEQLNAFVRFVKAKGLDDELRRLDWAAFARGYNGTGYRLNQYDEKNGYQVSFP